VLSQHTSTQMNASTSEHGTWPHDLPLGSRFQSAMAAEKKVIELEDGWAFMKVRPRVQQRKRSGEWT
jgi:hypothetical protein